MIEGELPIERCVLIDGIGDLDTRFMKSGKRKKLKILKNLFPNAGGLAQSILDAMEKCQKCHQPLLKGSDRLVMSAAKSLGLDVKVAPILAPEHPDPPYYINSDFKFKSDNDYIGEDWMSYLSNDKSIKDVGDITWCQEFRHWQPAIAALRFGNECTIDVCYQAAAILVNIPKWNKRKREEMPC